MNVPSMNTSPLSATPILFPAGTLVGARRWPLQGAHPGCWLPPLKGIVLDKRSLKAWEGTSYEHSQEDIDAHIAWCDREGLLEGTVPVLWTTSAGDETVYWEPTRVLRAYTDDYAAWRSARSIALRAERRRHSQVRLAA